MIRGLRPLAAAVLLAAGVWLPTVSSPPVAQAAVCTGWSSTTTPPSTIRVLRSSGPASGSVQTVDFKTYVKVVMPAEWPPAWPIESLRAGAVAIKQYAWYYTMHYRGLTGTGGCADVYDNNNDQIYAPETQTPAASHIQAVETTWGESIIRNGTFVFTGYRPGLEVGCGADADGGHLFQHSARNCALDGKTGEQILNVYYGPGLVIQGISVPDPPTSVVAIPYDTSAFVSWAAPAVRRQLADHRLHAHLDAGREDVHDGRRAELRGPRPGQRHRLHLHGDGNEFRRRERRLRRIRRGNARAGGRRHLRGPRPDPHPRHPLRQRAVRMSSARTRPARSQVTGRGGVPANAIAVTGNLTVTAQTSNGYLFIGPVATNNPTSSTLNFPVRDDRANGVTVALGAGGTLSVTYVASAGTATAHVIFDVTGYFVPDTSGATYVALTPARILDTRNGTGLAGPSSSHVARSFAVAGQGGVPANATAVTGNLTVTAQTSGGYLFVGPVATDNPTSSTLNFPVGDDRANGVTVALGSGGTLSVTYVASAGVATAHVIFDVTGYFVPGTSGSTYVPLNPARVVDSRNGTGLAGSSGSHVARSFTVAGTGNVPPTATAVTGNLTVTGQTSNGYLFIGPVATNNPTSSTLNFPRGDDRANGVTAALGSGGTLSVTFVAPAPGPTTHVIFDATGYFQP